MATLRKGKCYSIVKRPFVRRSKQKKKGYIKTAPNSKVVRYEMGDLTKVFSNKVTMVAKEDFQIRHNSMESSRQIINRVLSKRLGNRGYKFKINVFPHHVLRENKMLGGAGADRLQTGMAHSFGKSIGLAAQLKKGTTLFTVSVDREHVSLAKEALKKAPPRIPGKVGIVIA